MIKNLFVKKTLQGTIFVLFSYINRCIKHDKKVIMLYTNEGLRDNVDALLNYLIDEGYYNKYNIFCSANDYRSYMNKDAHVAYISNIKGILMFFRAGYVFYCFGKIPIMPGIGQEVVQLWHGTPFKAADEAMLKGHSAKRLYYTHISSPSPFFAPISSKYFSFPLDKFIICGHTRTDMLFKEWHYDLGDYDKLILWTPTFRQSERMGYKDTENDNLLPVLKMDDLSRINKILQEKNIKVIVKLHPMQNLEDYHIVEMDYFKLMSHNEFVGRGWNLYKLAAQSDALITDYSSFFYDYLLLNRPIGFTEDDVDEYTKGRGYAVDDPDSFKPGFRIKTDEDFLTFIDDLYYGIDKYKEERIRVNNLANKYQDGKSCQRILAAVGISKN